MARIGIIYSRETGKPHRVIVTDGALEVHQPGIDEEMLEVPEAEYQPNEEGKPVNIQEILASHGITQIESEE